MVLRTYIPAPDKVAVELDEARLHHQFAKQLVSGVFRGEIVALCPLHIGTGIIAPIEATGLTNKAYPMVKTFVRDANGRRILPGSSLKGAFRAIMEAITSSCISKANKGGKYGAPVPKALRECTYAPAKGQTSLCPACRMFGAMGYLGQVSFEDAPQIGEKGDIFAIPPQYSPKARQRERKFYRHGTPEPGTWPLEVCTPGSRFDLTVHFRNLPPAELGVFLIALGQGTPPICSKIGAGKDAGLGSICVRMHSVHCFDIKSDLLSYEPILLPASAAVYLEAARQPDSPLLTDQLQQLQDILACPHIGSR